MTNTDKNIDATDYVIITDADHAMALPVWKCVHVDSTIVASRARTQYAAVAEERDKNTYTVEPVDATELVFTPTGETVPCHIYRTARTQL